MTITSNVKLWKNYNSLINQRKDIDSNYTIYNNKIKFKIIALICNYYKIIYERRKKDIILKIGVLIGVYFSNILKFIQNIYYFLLTKP